MLHHDQLVAALERNLWSIMRVFGQVDGAELIDSPTRLIIQSPVAQPPYNSVLRFGDEADRPLEAQVADALAHFANREVVFVWLLHPTAPPGLAAALQAHGLACAEPLYGMARGLSDLPQMPPVPDGVKIIEPGLDDPSTWLHLVTWRYGLDLEHSPYLTAAYRAHLAAGSRLFIATIDGEPVSKVVMHPHEGVAGIFGVATTEAGRGKGLASLLTLHALHQARSAGLATSVLHATPMAQPVYARLGYDDVATFELWARPDSVYL